MSFSWHKYGDLVYLTSDLIAATGLVKHGFSTRHGSVFGMSTDNFDLGFKNGEPKAVRAMRQLFLGTLGMSLNTLVAGQQVHGTRVAVVTEADAGRGAMMWENGLPGTDALVTATADLPLSVYTADCVPLLFLDPVHKAVGAAHAGWRGSVNKIAVATLQALQNNYGSRPKDVLVAIGPSIGPCCYEVDDKVLLPLKEQVLWWREVTMFSRPGHCKLDLWELNRRLLLNAGISKNHISLARICTRCCVQNFFSYRGEQGRAGSLMAVISL
ncbi:MAG: peptidoglycan editing factor PgeF [Firmicutes bacterium]|nr:peptidoglycan editing factor PgeF [Bacillota bacterium]